MSNSLKPSKTKVKTLGRRKQAAPDPIPFPLLNLPPEVRLIVFRCLFEDAEIHVSGHHMTLGLKLYLENGLKSLKAILLTSKIIRREAAIALCSVKVTVAMQPMVLWALVTVQNFNNQFPIAWRSRVDTLVCPSVDSLDFSSGRFANVKVIKLPHRVYHVEEKKKPLRTAPQHELKAEIMLQVALDLEGIAIQLQDLRHSSIVQTLQATGCRVETKVWYLNDRRKYTTGWEATIDALGFQVSSVKKAGWNRIPYPEPQPIPSYWSQAHLARERRAWRRSPQGWDLLWLE